MNTESVRPNDRNQYVPLRNFGTALSPVLRTDPIAYSIYRDIDSFFDEGSLARTFGPSSKESMLYMAEHCSKTWDGACELLSRNNDSSKPNVGLVESPLFQHNAPNTLSIGDYLVLNSAIRRFGDLNSCSMSQSLYNVNDPTSPMVKSYGSYGTKQCMPVCKVPENPDNDIVLNKVLDQPNKFTDLLINMYYNTESKNRGIYKHTRIGKIFDLFDIFFSQRGSARAAAV